jgi:hypothetical protein
MAAGSLHFAGPTGSRASVRGCKASSSSALPGPAAAVFLSLGPRPQASVRACRVRRRGTLGDSASCTVCVAVPHTRCGSASRGPCSMLYDSIMMASRPCTHQRVHGGPRPVRARSSHSSSHSMAHPGSGPSQAVMHSTARCPRIAPAVAGSDSRAGPGQVYGYAGIENQQGL